MNYQERLLKVIPGGAHTYSRGFDQYPSNAPQILARGKGAYVFDANGKRYLDYGMALRAVNIGYAEERINKAAIAQIENGNNLTRPSLIELEAAETLTQLIDSVDMVKFTKNGSTATTAAVKLARAFTGRTLIARCSDHPFFSYDDWFIGSTPVDKGVTEEAKAHTKLFPYNDLTALERLVEQYPGQLACVILEPTVTTPPKDNFLHRVRELCTRNGIVLILDEMITGFRFHLQGAQRYFGIEPDLCTFGKAMANGFSVAAVCGKREIMQLGSIEFEGKERVFLLSTTHGAEMSGLGAFVETTKFLKEVDVIKHLWDYGSRLMSAMQETGKKAELEGCFRVEGYPCSPAYNFFGSDGKVSLPLRTLFLQEMVEAGVLMPWIALCYRHGDEELELTQKALSRALGVVKRATEEGIEKYLRGPAVKPVFRKYN